MPELPEVETTCNGIRPHIEGQLVSRVIIRQPKLRWPIPNELKLIEGLVIQQVKRYAKYIVLVTEKGHVLMHLGMSGSLRITTVDSEPEKHDHVDIVFKHGKVLRLRDPRRFGAVLWTSEPLEQHRLLAKLGVEPLSNDFDAEYLAQKAQKKKQSIKQFIMDSHIVVGVGNIYASESLFMARIDPRRAANSISQREFETLVQTIKKVLKQAIEQGGTTLKDFVREDGQTGYFQVKLQVYGRTEKPCLICNTTLSHIKQGQRSTWFCKQCQQ